MWRIPGPLGMDDEPWPSDEGTLVRSRSFGAAERWAVAPFHARRTSAADRVRQALGLSGPKARRVLQQRLAGLELNDIWQILLQACQDIALYYGGTVAAGAVLGGAAGSLGLGAGAVPGAVVGAGVGAKAGTWVLAWLGLKSLVEGLAQAAAQALRRHCATMRTAFGSRCRPIPTVLSHRVEWRWPPTASHRGTSSSFWRC